MTDKFKADEYKQKINLGVGDDAPSMTPKLKVTFISGEKGDNRMFCVFVAYRSEEGKPWVLPIVRAVEARVTTDETYNHEYLPVAGFPDYREAAYKLLLGSESPALRSNRVDSIQTCGGTGAIRVAADFLKQQLGFNTVYVSKPTWGNHRGIFKAAGFQNVKDYRYWDAANRDVDLKGWMEDLDITLIFQYTKELVIWYLLQMMLKIKKPSKSQMELIVRVTWSNPKKKNVKTMSDRIVLMRTKLYEKLKDLNTPGDWKHIIKQKGMFSFTGLNPSQVDRLIKKHHIYLLKNGRINMCALTLGNLEYVANCMHTVICEEQQQQTAKI
ncbi:hypothetical protein KUTeg_005282 [Tegillarca granosa]|uniref:aspartate transaminase n=1 Tax=Tegillarca granosa TaxID=220873 RepID=A0ABQ9FJA0_TEGGR|nr:hypothetical protein KUTeg_005282 [Tegillarca granosa]